MKKRETLRDVSRQAAGDVRDEIQQEATTTVEQGAKASGEALRELKDERRHRRQSAGAV